MISDFEKIKLLLEELNSSLPEKVHIYIMGGAVLLYHGLKPATKDIDIVVETEKEFNILEKTLIWCGFEKKIPTPEYLHMNLSQIFLREDFRIDIFCKKVCGGFSLSFGMMNRAEKLFSFSALSASLCSGEDIFMFKMMTERAGDLEDCIALLKRGLDWQAILLELQEQIKHSGRDV